MADDDCLPSQVTLPSTAERETIARLNVGGTVYHTKMETLWSRGLGRLGNLTSDDEAYNPDTKEYFFDCDGVFFQYVMQFYRTGAMHLASPFCFQTVRREMEFWGLGLDTIGDCCWVNFSRAQDQWESQQRLGKHMSSYIASFPEASHKPPSRKERIWIFLENPTSSLGAKILALSSVLLLLVSITCFALTTLPIAKRMYSQNRGNVSRWTELQVEESEKFLFVVTLIDSFCLSLFSVEFLLRIFSAPSRIAFVKSFLFFCDIFFLVPGWLFDGIILSGSGLIVQIASYNSIALVVLQILTVTRLFRIFRLAWYFQGIRILLFVLKASVRELLLLGIFLCTGVLFYGFLIYSAEVTVNQNFDSAFRGFWWAIITMSTVGYGDIVPVTTFGYIVAALCAISGLIVLGLPIPIIANNFDLYYGFQTRDHNKPDLNSEKVNDNSQRNDGIIFLDHSS